MKRTRIYLLLAFVISVYSLNAQVKDTLRGERGPGEWPFALTDDGSRGVYDEDDRLDATDAVGYEDFVRATAVMVSKQRIEGNRIYGWSLREALSKEFGTDKFDPEVKFLDQITVGTCTGFLIAPDILVTAGHCITELKDCQDFVWLFDYTKEIYHNDAGNYITVKQTNVYHCKEIIATVLNEDGIDYCFIRLDRKTDRDPYRFRTSGKIADYENIYMIGSSTGLPLKLSTNGYVRYNNFGSYFTSNLESFPGNSGGPVFDKAGFIEGIHVRGSVDEETRKGDYKYDKECDCIKLVQWDWPYGGYRGASAHRITSTPFDILLTAIYENIEYAIEKKDDKRLVKWLVYQGIIDHEFTVKRGRFEVIAARANNLTALQLIMSQTDERDVTDKDGRNLLYYAIRNGNSEMLDYLISEGANPSAKDDFGETPLHWAVYNGKSSMVKSLLDKGANPNAASYSGDTPLHAAARMGDMTSADYLISKGASVATKNNKGWTPRKVAKKSKNKSMASYLKKME